MSARKTWRQWSDADIRYLTEATQQGVKASEISTVLGRDASTIYAKRKRLKISTKPYRRAMELDDDAIRHHHFEGRGSPEIAKLLGLPLHSVTAIKRKLGLTSGNGGAWSGPPETPTPKPILNPDFGRVFTEELSQMQAGIDDRRRQLRSLASEMQRVQAEIDEANITVRMMSELQSRMGSPAQKKRHRNSDAAEARRMAATEALEAKVAARGNG